MPENTCQIFAENHQNQPAALLPSLLPLKFVPVLSNNTLNSTSTCTMKRFQQLICSFIQDCLTARSNRGHSRRTRWIRKMKWHRLALRNQSRKQASRNANYKLKRQALTNKDQRAVLPCYFLGISSGHATAIVVWCKQRYVRKLNLGNAWCLARTLRIEIAYGA